MLDSNISSEFYIKKAAENRERPINLPIQPCVFVIQVQPLFVFYCEKITKTLPKVVAIIVRCESYDANRMMHFGGLQFIAICNHCVR